MLLIFIMMPFFSPKEMAVGKRDHLKISLINRTSQAKTGVGWFGRSRAPGENGF